MFNRFHALVAGLFGAAATGGPYAFGVYSAALTKHWGLSGAQMGTITLVQYLGGLFSWVGGMVNDRIGPCRRVRSLELLFLLPPLPSSPRLILKICNHITKRPVPTMP